MNPTPKIGIFNNMDTTSSIPLTNQELAQADWPLRIKATEAEYWALLEKADYRADFFRGEIVASMSYESEIHSFITSRLNFFLQSLFKDFTKYRIHNSNRPVCIPACEHAIFNPDGSVIQQPAEVYEYQTGMTAELSPVLVFEVLSKTTRVRDLGEKLPCYQRIPSIQHILYVDSERLQVHHYQPYDDGQWLTTLYETAEDTIDLGVGTLALADLYAGVEWPK